MSRAKLWKMLAAIPAAISLLVIIVVALSIDRRESGPPAWYRIAADEAFDAGDYRTAAVCYQRLFQAHPDDQATAINLAQSLDAIGQHESAESLRARFR